MSRDPQPPTFRIALGLIQREDRFLVARRPEGSHLAGAWELPGGKVRPGESLKTALRREVSEETGIQFRDAILLHTDEHAYPERTVRLHFFLCRDPEGNGSGLEGQETRWVTLDELVRLEMPEGNRRFLEILREQHV